MYVVEKGGGVVGDGGGGGGGVVVQQKGLKQVSCVTGALESPSAADMLYRHTDAQRGIRCRWTIVVLCCTLTGVGWRGRGGASGPLGGH